MTTQTPDASNMAHILADTFEPMCAGFGKGNMPRAIAEDLARAGADALSRSPVVEPGSAAGDNNREGEPVAWHVDFPNNGPAPYATVDKADAIDDQRIWPGASITPLYAAPAPVQGNVAGLEPGDLECLLAMKTAIVGVDGKCLDVAYGGMVEHNARIDRILSALAAPPSPSKADVGALVEALELCLVGGNHIAGLLIDKVGAGFSERLPPGTDHDTALRTLHATDEYDLWCCWDAIMRARDLRDAALASFTASHDGGL